MTAGRLNRGFVYREQLGPAAHGVPTAAYLARRYDHTTEAEWRARIGAGEVFVDDRPASAEAPLRRGSWLVWHRPPWVEPDVPLSFDVLHEDADLLAVAKPSGLPTVPAGGFLEHTLLTLVQQRAPEATPMHRLGRGTSGIVLFARTPHARSTLQTAWRTHQVRKVYRALASGRLPAEPFTIEVPIGPVAHPVLGELFAASAEGKPARSHVTVVEQRAAEALVDVAIDTGRPHQIRIHLAAAGHPLVGDPLYVAGGVPAPETRSLPGDLGYLLHAMVLAFVHPSTGREVVVTCPPPEALRMSGER